MNAALSTLTEEQEQLDAELANEKRQLDAELAKDKRQLEAELESQRLRLEAEREHQQIGNQRTRAELEAIREQVAVLGVDGYIALKQNEALQEAIANGDANVFVIPQGTPVELPGQ